MTIKKYTDSDAVNSAIAAELRQFFSMLKRRMRDEGHTSDLSPGQSSALLRLEKEGPMTISSLAQAEGIRHQSMRTLVSALQSKGLVRGTADPEDGRQIIISLTDKCLSLLQEGRSARQDWLSRAVAQHLTGEEQRQVLAAIGLLQKLVEK